MRKIVHAFIFSSLAVAICVLAQLSLSNTVAVPSTINGFASSNTTTANATSAPTQAELTAKEISKISSNDSYDVCSNIVAPGTAHCNALVRRGPLSPKGQNSGATDHTAGALGDNGAYSPKYLQSAYNVLSLESQGNNGNGQIIGVVDAYSNPNLLANLNYYRNYFGLAPCHSGTVSSATSGCVVQQVNENGGATLPAGSASWGMEQAIDVDMVSAICPNCQLLIVDANSAQIPDLGTAVNTAVKMGAVAVTNSYGTTEYPSEVSDANLYYNHPGVAIVVAAGDTGYGVQFPAAAPSVIAVGGTTLVQRTDNGTRSGTETAWSGTASGCSAYEPKPSWQHDTGCKNRSVADVAAVADPNTGVWIYDTFGQPGLMIAGGTSVAAPIVGSLYALANTSLPATSQPASFLYQNANSLVPVTSGSDGTCGSYLCNASMSVGGYNGPTGMGTPGATPSSVAALTGSNATSAPAPTSGGSLNANVSSGAVASNVSAGSNFSCSLLQGGSVQCWGINTDGQLGNGSTLASTTPVIVTGLSNIAQLSVGADHACAVLHNGVVKCWGNNANGQLGVAKIQDATRPVTVKIGASVTSVASGYDYTCALLSSGNVECWGGDTFGQSGNSTNTSIAAPKVVSGVSGVRQIAVNLNHTCALLSSGSIECWGANNDGQLGNGSTQNSPTPVAVTGLKSVVQVAVGANSSCAILSGGTVECWGYNGDGELGNNTLSSSSTPVTVVGVGGATSLSMSSYAACVLSSSATVSCWGYAAGSLFGGTSTSNVLQASTVSSLSGVSGVALGNGEDCALASNGSVQVWNQGSLQSTTMQFLSPKSR